MLDSHTKKGLDAALCRRSFVRNARFDGGSLCKRRAIVCAEVE